MTHAHWQVILRFMLDNIANLFELQLHLGKAVRFWENP